MVISSYIIVVYSCIHLQPEVHFQVQVTQVGSGMGPKLWGKDQSSTILVVFSSLVGRAKDN